MTFSSQPDTDDYLVHYGVLGMKWGVRKNRSKSSSGGKKQSSKKYYANTKIKNFSPSMIAKNAVKVALIGSAGATIFRGAIAVGSIAYGLTGKTGKAVVDAYSKRPYKDVKKNIRYAKMVALNRARGIHYV